jgi:hypothetical protein
MVQVEKVLDQWKTVLGVFLDIEGTFNNASFDSMCATLVKQGLDHIIVHWIRATLEGCLAVTTLNEFSTRVVVSSCCPWEGVLSPILLSSFVDDLIARLSGNGICIQGYADDICLLLLGKFPNLVSGLMQWALYTVETWCDEVGLSVNLDKTELVVSTRRRKPPHFLKPLFWGYLRHCILVKYLGVVLDTRPADIEGACGCHDEESSQSVLGL